MIEGDYREERSEEIPLRDLDDPMRELKPWARTLWTRVKPEVGMEDLVLPKRTRELLDALLAEAEHHRTLKRWGFEDEGVTALFTGPPGTGKTMAASAVAARLRLDLLVARADKIVSNFVHGTQENIGRLFEEAARERAVLFLDEADGLLAGRLSEVREWEELQHNADIAVFLQRMEEYRGLLILATNFPLGFDSALERRISIEVPFEMPGKEERRLLWERYLPPSAPLSLELDLEEIASRYPLSGASIKNAARQAARFALLRGGERAVISHADVRRACETELNRRGRAAARGRPAES